MQRWGIAFVLVAALAGCGPAARPASPAAGEGPGAGGGGAAAKADDVRCGESASLPPGATPAVMMMKATVAILGLEVVDDGSGLDPKAIQFAKELTEDLRDRAKAGTGPFALAPGSDKDLLEMKMLDNCDSEAVACMAAIGASLAADRLIYGKVEKRDNGYQISLKLLNVGAKTFERSISDIVPFGEATGANRAGWSKKLYVKLTGSTEEGSVTIQSSVERGTIYVDDQVRGSLVGGMARIDGLSEGTYCVIVEYEGGMRVGRDVTITAGEDTTLDLTDEM